VKKNGIITAENMGSVQTYEMSSEGYTLHFTLKMEGA
jgi:hypothetical protein